MTVGNSTATDETDAAATGAGIAVGKRVLAASRGAAMARVDDWGRFTLGGRDGRKFLQGLTTNDVLKLEPGALYDKYVGETERNFRRAVRLAETMAPAVLWIDELEKASAAGGGDGGADGGLSGRLLGSFLSWLQERREGVFVVATANDVGALPPELVRKGRFDEIFFVDLPDAAARRETLALHLRRRQRDPAAFALDALAAATDGFSGAELEALVVAALYAAFAAEVELSTALLVREAELTRPLSRLMPERVAALRAWAHGRTRSAACFS